MSTSRPFDHLRSAACTLALLAAGTASAQTGRLDVRLATDEADAVLAILAKRASAAPVTEQDWQRLFSSEGYRRLKQREASLQRAFEDSTFRSFVLSSDLLAKRAALGAALEEWASVDLMVAARRAFAYLPDHATIRVKVYPSIKPRTNTFVFEPRTDPAIFFYLDPAVSPEKFENILAHEFHHIGLASACPESADTTALAAVVAWMGGFAEGRAVLAAAGSPDVHPHATSDSTERAIWDRDYANVTRDMHRLEEFYQAIAEGALTEDEQTRRGMAFVTSEGVPQGPFYTVGYLMARTVAQQFGRERLVASTCDSRRFLTDYNEAAALHNGAAQAQLPLWSEALLRRVGALPGSGGRPIGYGQLSTRVGVLRTPSCPSPIRPSAGCPSRRPHRRASCRKRAGRLCRAAGTALLR